MSDPPTSSLNTPHPSSTFHHQHHHHPPPLPPPLLPPPPPPTNPSSPSTTSSPLAREYRKGNWTVHETLILITAKRLNDERRSSRPSSLDIKPLTPSSTSPSTPPCRSAELRWKWVENYCWRNGCLRSQNQCNDKWDNLLRDYKKVRDYESRTTTTDTANNNHINKNPSYWNMEKHDRKERNLPSNLASEVFHALTDVLSRRNAHKSSPRPPPHLHLPLPTPSPALPPPPPPPSDTGAETSGAKSESAEDDEEEEEEEVQEEENAKTELNAKRRKKARDLGSSVARGASVLARTLLACEEMREKRHRELVELEARRLRMEEDRTEMSRQGISGLIAAVNGLSGAIHALVSDRPHHHRRRNDEC